MICVNSHISIYLPDRYFYSVLSQELQLHRNLLTVPGHVFLLNKLFLSRSKHNLVKIGGFFHIFLYINLGVNHHTNCSLKKDHLPNGMLKNKHCFSNRTCQNPADLSSLGKYWTLAASYRNSSAVCGKKKLSPLVLFISKGIFLFIFNFLILLYYFLSFSENFPFQPQLGCSFPWRAEIFMFLLVFWQQLPCPIPPPSTIGVLPPLLHLFLLHSHYIISSICYVL